jgi:hypothetical protein
MLIRITLLGLLTVASGLYAQPHGRGGPGDARFLGAAPGMPGRTVRNAPYSAEMVTETSQALADGNRIRQSSSSKFYRDSEGRTRREQSLTGLNGLAPNSNFGSRACSPPQRQHERQVRSPWAPAHRGRPRRWNAHHHDDSRRPDRQRSTDPSNERDVVFAGVANGGAFQTLGSAQRRDYLPSDQYQPRRTAAHLVRCTRGLSDYGRPAGRARSVTVAHTQPV